MSTIKQKTVLVTAEDGSRIEVRRMAWKGLRDFLRSLANVVRSIYQGSTPEQPTWALILAKLPEIITGSDELVVILCTKSTDLKPDEFDNLDALTASNVLSAAIGVNFDDEVKNSLAGIVGKIAALMPAAKPTTT